MSDARVYDMLAEVFRREGVKACFALMGDANMCFTARLVEAGCRGIFVRHEHCAVGAAMACARKTGEVSVASVTCGPGLTQAMTALPAAAIARIPLVIFAGEAPLGRGWYNQRIEQTPFGAAYHALHAPERMAEQARDAFLQARKERRPVVIGVPFDLQDLPWGGDTLPIPAHELAPKLSPLQPHPHEVAQVAEMIAGTRRILIVAGLGAVAADAARACRGLAARCDAFLGSTLPARGFFHDDPYNVGIVGGYSTDAAKAELKSADLVLAVGCSLAFHNTMGGKLFPDARVVQIDTDPRPTTQGYISARHHMRADAPLAMEALATATPERPADWRSLDLADRLANATPRSSGIEPEPGLHDPREVVAALQDAIPGDWEMVNTSGHVSAFTAHMPGRPADRFLAIREFGAIGNGTSFAMGVAAARSDRAVVLLDGDGSLLMHVQELETIRRHGMKILIVAFNDGAYSSETHKLAARGLPMEGARFGRTDFAALARALGIGGETVTDLSALPDLASAFAAGVSACVWDVPITERVLSPVMQRLLAGAGRPAMPATNS